MPCTTAAVISFAEPWKTLAAAALGNGRIVLGSSLVPGNQAAGTTGESRAWRRASFNSMSDKEKPFMSSDVISGAGPKTSSICRPRREWTTSLTMTPISMAATPPRLFTRRPSLDSPEPKLADNRSTIRSTICLTDLASITAAPGSP